MKITYRTHALVRMFQRQIQSHDVRNVLSTGEVIEDYPTDMPYPSRLMLGWCQERPIHIVVAYNAEEDETIVVTVYEPDPARWSADFRMRLP